MRQSRRATPRPAAAARRRTARRWRPGAGRRGPAGPRTAAGRGMASMVQRGRVELDELDVGHGHAGPEGHGDAVAGGLERVGRDGEQLAGPAGGDEHVGGPDLRRLARPSRRAVTPRHRPPSTIRSTAKCVLVDRRRRAAGRPRPAPARPRRRSRTRRRARRGPACGRLRGPAPARRRASRSKIAPSAMSSWTRSGPSSTSTRTASASHSPAPAARVSARWRSVESGSSWSTAATPPCAHRVVACGSSPLVSTPTRMRWVSAARTAADSPATPDPSTSRSSSVPVIVLCLVRRSVQRPLGVRRLRCRRRTST